MPKQPRVSSMTEGQRFIHRMNVYEVIAIVLATGERVTKDSYGKKEIWYDGSIEVTAIA